MTPSFALAQQPFAYPFMVHAFEAGTLVAVAAAVTGWFVVLRRQTFAAHALSIMSFLGASAAALAGVALPLGYFAACGLAAVAIAVGSRTGDSRNVRGESAAIATVQVVGFALGFLLLSLYGGILESLESLLFGSFLGVTAGQVETLLAVLGCVLAFFAVAGRPLLFASIDDLVARAGGVRVRALEVAFLLVLGLTVAATAQITGALLVFALLVAPAAAAQQLTARVDVGLALSVAIALLATWLGLLLAYYTDDSVGFLVTTLAFACYVAARAARRFAEQASRGADLRPAPAPR
jgi:zinc/manganese transport system permease protein